MPIHFESIPFVSCGTSPRYVRDKMHTSPFPQRIGQESPDPSLPAVRSIPVVDCLKDWRRNAASFGGDLVPKTDTPYGNQGFRIVRHLDCQNHAGFKEVIGLRRNEGSSRCACDEIPGSECEARDAIVKASSFSLWRGRASRRYQDSGER
jgi:hypothetical protein